MPSDALIAMIERKLKAYGLEKVIPDDDVLGEAYQAFHRSQQLRVKFKKMEDEFDGTGIEVPENLQEQVRAVLDEHRYLRWDDAIQIALDRRSSIACGQRSKRPKRNPVTSRSGGRRAGRRAVTATAAEP